MIHLVIVSEKDSERLTMQQYLDSQPDITIVGQGRDGYDALKLVSRLKPDIILLDESLPMADGTAITPTLKYRSPKTGIIILTAFQENIQVLKAINCGASGYLLKNTLQEKFIAGIKTVYNGGCLMSPETAAKAFRMFSDTGRSHHPIAASVPSPQKKPFPLYSSLSKQELQVITCIARGFSNKEISEYLSLKEGTVRNYISTIFEKTGVKNRTQVALYAYSIGLMKGEKKHPLHE
ncbi:MAG: response regulator transcription factor [Treponema sp.]|jgi:DNA-binding NarL/FixJ family response regulator|nr:response regulator transcription factor [Treponema sp.]